MLSTKIYNLSLNDNHNELNELPSKVRVKFAFVGDNKSQLHQETYCRDILTGIVWGVYNNKNTNYSIVFNPVKDLVSSKYTRLSLHYYENHLRYNPEDSAKEIKSLKKNIRKLNAIEKTYGILPTKLYTTMHSDILVVEGDVGWQNTCWKISLYTFLLRWFSKQVVDDPCRDHEIIHHYNTQGNLNFLLSNFNNSEWDGEQQLKTHIGISGFQSFLDKSRIFPDNAIYKTFTLPEEVVICAV